VGEAAAARGTIVPVAALVGVPQLEQNFAPGAMVTPHAAQAWLSADPQSAQNFADAEVALPQLEQTMGSGDASTSTPAVPLRAM
jgi:hypothetical protein